MVVGRSDDALCHQMRNLPLTSWPLWATLSNFEESHSIFWIQPPNNGADLSMLSYYWRQYPTPMQRAAVFRSLVPQKASEDVKGWWTCQNSGYILKDGSKSDCKDLFYGLLVCMGRKIGVLWDVTGVGVFISHPTRWWRWSSLLIMIELGTDGGDHESGQTQ